MPKEIEVKATVANPAALKSQLESLGCIFSEPVTQHDTIFVDFDGDFSAPKTGRNFLRIREAGGKLFFTLKQSHTNELDCIEKEFEISDAVQCRESLELMGYHEAVQVHKTRMKTNYHDMEICLDDVVGLGSFVEVEKITDGDGALVQEELFLFLESLGVSREDRVMRGYDTLVYLKSQ
jgi:adenylate cyclase class 2